MFRQTWSVLLVLVAVAVLLPASRAFAVDLANGWWPSPLEIAQTPPYCQKQFYSKHDADVMRPLFRGCARINHFCPGLVLLNRAADVKIAKAERQRILRAGKGDIEYSLSRLTPQCIVYNDVKAAEQRVRLLEMMLK